MNTIFDSMYVPYESELRAFGKHWIGPATYRHFVEEGVALFRKSPPNGDGQHAHVYCLAAPSRFYTVVAEAGVNSVGEPKPGFKVSFGSGQAELAARIAIAISEGMIGFESLADPSTVTP